MNTKKIYAGLIVFLILLIVCMTLFSPIPDNIKLLIRVLFILISLVSWWYFKKKELVFAKDLSYTFLALNLAFLIVSFFTPLLWGLETNTARGIALLKLSDSVIISSVLILACIAGGYKLNRIFITKGKLLAGIIIGTVFFLFLGYLAMNNPQAKIQPGFLSKYIHWILIFVFANAFMEELIFRGIFLEKLNSFFKPFWSILITSVCFSVPHLLVNYSPNVWFFTMIVFVLGMLCGYAMHYTRSIIAPTLIHAGADLLIIIPIFSSYGVNG